LLNHKHLNRPKSFRKKTATMADKYMQLVLTPSVQQAQVKYFGQRTIRTALGSSCSATLACSTRVRIPSSLNDSPPEPLRSKVERLFLIQVISYDWNCPQYITPRFTAGEMEICRTAESPHCGVGGATRRVEMEQIRRRHSISTGLESLTLRRKRREKIDATCSN
jgi:hypothetical protein